MLLIWTGPKFCRLGKGLKDISFTLFLQLQLISPDSASWELHQYWPRMCGPMRNPKVDTRPRESKSGPRECAADALPHDHGHHQGSMIM